MATDQPARAQFFAAFDAGHAGADDDQVERVGHVPTFHPAQQLSAATSFSKVWAASFSPPRW
jgi:hypothetical protein